MGGVRTLFPRAKSAKIGGMLRRRTATVVSAFVLAAAAGCTPSSGPSAGVPSGGAGGAPAAGSASGGASGAATGGNASGEASGGATGGGATGGSPGAGGTAGDGAGGGDETAGIETQLLYNGALRHRSIEISAPILPRTSVIYKPFPATLDGEKQMAHDAALLFDQLLVDCAPPYPTITLDPAGAGLSPEQLGVNYDQVGLCSYMQDSAKPYWIPKLVGDVDICGTEMGPDWHLITEGDLAAMQERDFQSVADVWNHHPAGGQGLSEFFASLQIWVRASDGTIAQGTLAPGAGPDRVTPLEVAPTSTNHYEGSLGLRCLRGATTRP